MSPPPRFSIVVVHYQGTVPHHVFCRGIASLKAQTYPSFEILAYHDGPLLEPDVAWPVPVRCTEVRHNDWGHSLRDRGIREAAGDYVVHFNADNLLYPCALAEIAREIDRPPYRGSPPEGFFDRNDVIIFPVVMWGLARSNHRTFRSRTDRYTILTGVPPVLENIDCMQLVMRRELWLREGGWKDRREWADGYLYPELARKYGYRHVGPVLGEHF